MKVFLSYTHKDADNVRLLADGMRMAGHDVWFDRELVGGAEWWRTILEQIRSSDAFVVAVSPATLSSTACSREREYAGALRKPIVPVLVGHVPVEVLPSDIAQRQVVDFTTPDTAAAFRLAGGLAGIKVTELPVPLPPEPEAPMSYLSDISSQVHASSLARDEQILIAARLRQAVSEDDHRSAALELISALMRRDDLYAVTERDLREILEAASSQAGGGPTQGPVTVVGGTVRPDRDSLDESTHDGPTHDGHSLSEARAGRTAPGELLLVVEGSRPLVGFAAGALAIVQDVPTSGGRELLRVQLATDERLRVPTLSNATMIDASSGGVVVATDSEVVTHDPALRETRRWAANARDRVIDVAATRRCAWALIASDEAAVSHRGSIGKRYADQLVRISFDSGDVSTFHLGPDTFWISPIHFRGLQLIAVGGNEGREVAVLRCEWTTPGLSIRKTKLVSFAAEGDESVRVVEANTYATGSDTAPDLRQLARWEDRLLLAYWPAPGAKARLGWSDERLGEATTLHEFDEAQQVWWIRTANQPIALVSRADGVEIYMLTRSGHLEQCGTLPGRVMTSSTTLHGVLRDLHVVSCVSDERAYWSMIEPEGLASIDPAGVVTITPTTDFARVVAADHRRTFQLRARQPRATIPEGEQLELVCVPR